MVAAATNQIRAGETSAADLATELADQGVSAIDLGDLFIDGVTLQLALPNGHPATVELRAGDADTPPTRWIWTSTSPHLTDPAGPEDQPGVRLDIASAMTALASPP
jgi:hypothetical protein